MTAAISRFMINTQLSLLKHCPVPRKISFVVNINVLTTLYGNFGFMLHACSILSSNVPLRPGGHASKIVQWLSRYLHMSVR